VRAAEFSGGNRKPKKRMPVGESQQETTTTGCSSRQLVVHNWPDTGLKCAGLERGADVGW
jgi:hypothetical protein